MDYNNTGAERASDYWATREGDAINAAIKEQVTRYVEYCRETGRTELWERSRCAYYRLDSSGNWRDAAAVRFTGEQGENVSVRVNHFRSLLDHVHVLTTGSRPSFSARAANADYKSQAQTAVAEGALDYYLTTHRIEDQAKEVAGWALRYGEGWMYVGWDERDGDPVRVVPGAPTDDGEPSEDTVEYTGDVLTRVFQPIDITRDVTADSEDDVQWVIAHRRISRWDLAARYPEHQQKILDAPEYCEAYERNRKRAHSARRGEQVSVLELWHDRTDAIPDGRHVIVCGEAVLMDVPLPYEELPFIRMAPASEDGTPFGFSGAFDLLSLQEALDAAMSTILTNHDAFGRQLLWTPTGSKVSADDVNGMTILTSNEKPEPIQLLLAQKESYDLLNAIKGDMEQISGINSVARGEPQASLKSGSALALVHSMAVQYNAGIQHGYARLFEKMGTMLVSRLKTFASAPRMIEISGKRGRAMLREFSGSDIGDVQRVVVELGSAVLRTSAGRKELADKFFEASLATSTPMTFEQYLEVMGTGRLDPIIERPTAQRLNIVRENELMMEGQAVPVLITDHHAHHISEHLAVLDDPSVRADALLAPIMLEHIQQHANLWAACDPVLLAATGQQPAPAPMMPAAPPMAGGGAPMPGGSPDPQQQAQVEGMDMPNPTEGMQAAALPNMPSLPPGTDPSAVEAAQQGAMQ